MEERFFLFIKEMITEAEKKVPYASATFFNNRGVEIRIDNKQEKVTSSPSNLGLVFSLFNGEFFEEYATDNLEIDYLKKFLRNAIENTKVKRIKYKISPGEECEKSFKTKEKTSPDNLTLTEKIDLMRSRRDKILKGKDIKNGVVAYWEEWQKKVFCNRRRRITEEVRRINNILSAFATDGKNLKYDYISVGGTGGLELIDISDSEIEGLAENARALLFAKKIEPNFYDVVATPEISGLIAHEAFGHGVETDMYIRHRARSQAYLGKQIAAPIVNIIDNPALPNGFGSYFIDDEGEIARPTHIIKNGKYIQGLTDFYSHSLLNLPRTANGRRESFERKIYTRMSNTYFQSGKSEPEELINSVKRGVYLIKGHSGMEDPKGWGIQVIVLYGKEIKDGKITNNIFSPIGITGYVPDLLMNVNMVANDFRVDVGFCGKGHKEIVPVSSGGPHIKTRVRLG